MRSELRGMNFGSFHYGDLLDCYWRFTDNEYETVVNEKSHVNAWFTFGKISRNMYLKHKSVINFRERELLVFNYDVDEINLSHHLYGSSPRWAQCLSASETISLRNKVAFVQMKVDEHIDKYKFSARKRSALHRHYVRTYLRMSIISLCACIDDILAFPQLQWSETHIANNMNLSEADIDRLIDLKIVSAAIKIRRKYDNLSARIKHRSDLILMNANAYHILNELKEFEKYSRTQQHRIMNAMNRRALVARKTRHRTVLWLIYETVARNVMGAAPPIIWANFARLVK